MATQTHQEMLAAEQRTKRRLELAVALALLLPTRKRDGIEVGIFTATLAGRVDASNAGLSAAAREVRDAVRGELPVGLFGESKHAAGYIAEAVDIRRAQAVARSYGEALAKAEATEKAASIAEAARQQAYRLERIAATETAQAFNTAKTHEVERRAERAGIVLMKTWDASLDKRTCSVCSGLDGTSARVGESYPGGQEPGSVHSYCRCTETISALH